MFVKNEAEYSQFIEFCVQKLYSIYTNIKQNKYSVKLEKRLTKKITITIIERG